jgi:hypothetical protein
MRARPVAASVPTPLSRLARRRGQLDVVSTRVPTPGDASAGGAVAFALRRASSPIVQRFRVKTRSQRKAGKSANERGSRGEARM